MFKKIDIGRTLLMGDSYSTFKDYIPEGYVYWYDAGVNGVMGVQDTWWGALFSKVESELVLNDSFSGTTISHRGYDGKDVSDRSFITRARKLLEDGFFEREKIDTVLVFGGTNDTWANVPLGKFTLGEISEEEMYSVLPAISYYTRILRQGAPNARIIFIVSPILKQEIQQAVFAAAEHFGCEAVLLSAFDVENGHPTKNGMYEIADCLYNYLNK